MPFPQSSRGAAQAAVHIRMGRQVASEQQAHLDSSDDLGSASTIVGQTHYVELLPKISYPEFCEKQACHFPHLDKIEEEMGMSFKEDSWALQGKQRQNKE